MSYIAAVGAKNKVNQYLSDFDLGETAQSGLKAGAYRNIAETEYGAQKDYNSSIGEATLSGIKEAGSAAVGAQQKAMFGDMLGTAGSLAMGVSDFGVKKGWFG